MWEPAGLMLCAGLRVSTMFQWCSVLQKGVVNSVASDAFPEGVQSHEGCDIQSIESFLLRRCSFSLSRGPSVHLMVIKYNLIGAPDALMYSSSPEGCPIHLEHVVSLSQRVSCADEEPAP